MEQEANKEHGGQQDDYGSTEDNALLGDHTTSESRKKELKISGNILNNVEIRTIFQCLLLFSWVLPKLTIESIRISDTGSCSTNCVLWMIAYCCILGGICKFIGIAACEWVIGIGNLPVWMQKLIPFAVWMWSIILAIGGLFVIIASGDSLNVICDDVYCKCGYFGIYLFPSLTAMAMSVDYMTREQYNFGQKITIRTSVLAAIICISSLLITIDAFNDFANTTEYVYGIGWLFVLIVSFARSIVVAIGLAKYVQIKCKWLYHMMGVLGSVVLFSGVSLSMVDSYGLINESRTAFLIFAECATLAIEANLL